MWRYPVVVFVVVSLFFVLGGSLLPTGCSRDGMEIVQETDERNFQRGKQFQREGRNEEALAAFLRVIDERADAAESHLEAGTIYLQHFRDPILAIYHFTRYLEKRPGSRQSDLVRGLVDQGRKLFASQLPGQPFADDFDRLDLLEMLETERRENARLRSALQESALQVSRMEERLAQAARLETRLNQQQQTAASPRQNENVRRDQATTQQAPTAGTPSQSVPETYTVAPGDTLSRISNNVFGTSARWRDIFEANRHILSSPDDLRVGQVLRIPQN